ncbi:GMP synthase subunit A [Thermococcus peptonophilus]|uniref:GMP synthase [glutamine-hydrolyzing] subunit A n=1 Tax=Thermococcus peptonophilus TaxID=53952 RepID=A0A142CTW0_9EURY|nr:GMP synthase subunit A [Thermococcus peptonophilus]AMQ18212.1 GMP synthase [Thermococcus peptonophilus]
MIVIMDNGGQYVHRIWRTLRYLGVEAKIIPNTTPLEEIKTMKPKGIIFSGGPDISRTGNCSAILEHYDEFNVPILGICLGHQLIAKHFGGKVGRGEKAEYSLVEIEILDEDDLFKGLPRKLRVWESHMDEVKELPPGFKLLAKSETCPVEAMKHERLPIYGVQFHPEVAHTEHGAEVYRNFAELCGEL